jgi:hypothetical protein
MSTTQAALPAGFEALTPFVADWALATANQRLTRRLASSEAERVAFFEAAKPLLADGLAYLDQTPLDQFDEAQTRLMRLLLGFAHVSLAVEVQGDEEPKHAHGARFITITRAPADL